MLVRTETAAKAVPKDGGYKACQPGLAEPSQALWSTFSEEMKLQLSPRSSWSHFQTLSLTRALQV